MVSDAVPEGPSENAVVAAVMAAAGVETEPVVSPGPAAAVAAAVEVAP